jgi:hypothetical protein
MLVFVLQLPNEALYNHLWKAIEQSMLLQKQFKNNPFDTPQQKCYHEYVKGATGRRLAFISKQKYR